MKYYRTRKSLDQVIGVWSKYVTKNWVEINDESTRPQNLGHHINLSFQFTQMLRSRLWWLYCSYNLSTHSSKRNVTMAGAGKCVDSIRSNIIFVFYL